MTASLIEIQFTILTYLIIGFILFKTRLIDHHAQVFISDLTIGVLLPASVFTSFISNLTLDLLKSLGMILVFATVIEVVLYLLTKIPMGNHFSHSEACIARYGMLVSNGGLIGTPVVEALFGSVGVMCCNVFLIPTRIMAFSAGESIFNPSLKRSGREILYSILTNRIIIVMVLGMILVGFHLTLPSPVFTALQKIGGCLSPFSLILVGSMLAEKMTVTKTMIRNIALISFLRLILIPLAVLAFCLLMRQDFQTTAIMTLLMGMPVGSTCASFSKKYKGNEAFASSVVFVSTILSMVTLVLLMQLMEMIF